MEEALGHWSEYIALMVEAVAIGVVSFGAIEAFVRLFQPFFEGPPDAGWRRSIWNDFGMWLLLGLQFALAADIVRSVIAPTWEDLGFLAALAAIRTFLSFFLERDIREARPAPGRERIEA
jgi:uncharacterized membrane protein